MTTKQLAQQRMTYFDGQMIKSIDLPQYPDEAWNWLTGKPDADKAGVEQYFKAIPWLFRGVQLRAQAVANMPFALVKDSGGGGKDFDHSQEWENKVGFLPNPSDLLWLIEAALTLTGKCYLWRKFQGMQTLGLRYILPTSVTWEPVKDVNGVVQFDKANNKPKVTWERDLGQGPKPIPDGSIVYLWAPDPYVEFGEPTTCPAVAALMAAGVLANMDEFIANFFRRGAIKATVFMAENMPKGEAEKLETWFKHFVSGVRNAFTTKVFNAGKMEPMVIGDGVSELENIELNKEKREDIATALGIPQSILFSNAANFATAQQDELNFLKTNVVPEAQWIAAVLTEQVFKPLGLRMEIRHETLDAFQEDENERAQAVKLYTDAGFPLLMACDILGVELTDEQRAELVAAEAEKKARAEELANRLANAPQTPEGAQPGQNGKQPQPPEPIQQPNPAQEDIKRWERKAIKAIKNGKRPDVPFKSEFIPVELSAEIANDLVHLSLDNINPSTRDVEMIFKRALIEEKPEPVDSLFVLAMELKRANNLLERTADNAEFTV